MIQLLFAAIIIGLLWFFMGHKQQTAVKEQIQQELPTSDTVKGFQSDVQRAKDAADKANQLIKKQEEDAKRGMRQME